MAEVDDFSNRGCHNCGEYVVDVGCGHEALETAFPCRYWRPLGSGSLVAAFKADFAEQIEMDDHICPDELIRWLAVH